ncbi:MAG: type II secretion system protein N [Pseudomonadota bacterium]
MRVLRMLALLVIFGLAVGAGFGLMTPLGVLAPDLAAAASARGVTLPSESRLARGQAQVALPAGTPLSLPEPQDVSWRLTAPSLWPLGLSADLTLGGPWQGQAALTGAALPAGAVTGSATVRAGAAEIINAPLLALQGAAEIVIDDMEVQVPGGRIDRLAGRLFWRDAAFRLDEEIVLGTVRGDLRALGPESIAIALSNSGSDISLAGRATLDLAARSVALDVEVTLPEGEDGTARAILEGWGTGDGSTYRITRTIPY